MSIRDLIPRRDRSDPLSSLRRDMDSLLTEFSRSNGWPFTNELPSFLPSIDVSETVEGFHVTAELPGLDEKLVQVSVENDVLTISGTKEEQREEKGREWYHRERTSGSFRRSVRLPAAVDANKAEAKFAKGVLTIDVPKRADAKASRHAIPIKSA